MDIKQIYWFYKVIKNIKSNHIEIVKTLVEKYFKNDFNNYFLKISYSYSYDCFDYFYKRLKIKNGGEYFFSYYTQVNVKTENYQQLEKVFYYDFGQGDESKMEDFDSEDEIDRLRYHIVNSLIKKNKFDIITDLIKNISQKSKNCIFKAYLEHYKKFNQEKIEKLISILNINQTFFEKKVLDYYYPNINKQLYLFLKNTYDIDRNYYIYCFLRTDNKEVIEQMSEDFNVSVNDKIKKIHKTLCHDYKYEAGKNTFDIIHFYQSIGYLNEENIVNSFNKKNDEIIIDYTYLPLLKLSKSTEIAMLKKNLNIIIFEKQYNYNYNDIHNIKSIITKIENYFDFIKDKIDINHDNEFIQDLLEPVALISSDILMYFYKKFPELFIKQAFKIFTRYLNDKREIKQIVQEILNEKNTIRQNDLLNIFVRAYQAITYHHEEHNNAYFLIKNFISDKHKKDILYSKITHYSALSIIKDILEQVHFKNNNISHLFLESICAFSKNTLYLLEKYSIDISALKDGFIKLIYHENNVTNLSLATHILEKNIELLDYEQYLVKQHNIELYKLYQSYSLNRKLEKKYAIKNTKEKLLKI